MERGRWEGRWREGIGRGGGETLVFSMYKLTLYNVCSVSTFHRCRIQVKANTQLLYIHTLNCVNKLTVDSVE